MKKEQVLTRMKEDCLVAVVRAKNLEQGEKVVEARRPAGAYPQTAPWHGFGG